MIILSIIGATAVYLAAWFAVYWLASYLILRAKGGLEIIALWSVFSNIMIGLFIIVSAVLVGFFIANGVPVNA